MRRGDGGNNWMDLSYMGIYKIIQETISAIPQQSVPRILFLWMFLSHNLKKKPTTVSELRKTKCD